MGKKIYPRYFKGKGFDDILYRVHYKPEDDNDFVQYVVKPFEADSREDAIKHIQSECDKHYKTNN